MSYLTFHLLLTLPPILALAFTQPRPLAGIGGHRARWGIPLICLIAFVYTTPWDNYLVYHNVWSYGPERVLATIGYVPVEEYAFFILQTVLTGLFFYQLLARSGIGERLRNDENGSAPVHPLARRLGTGFFAALSVAGAALLLSGWRSGLYAGLILAWAGPILTLLWAVAGNVAWHARRVFALAVFIPSLYLWCADVIALRAGVWHITEATSLNVEVLGLPVEEGTFFVVTNLLVGLGLLAWLFGDQTAAHRFLQPVLQEKTERASEESGVAPQP